MMLNFLALILVLILVPIVVLAAVWLAKCIGVLDGFLNLMGSVLSSTVVLVGAFVWFVNKFSEEIGRFIDRIKAIGSVALQTLTSKSDEGATARNLASDSVASDKGKKSTKAKSASADDYVAKIRKGAEAGDAEAQCALGMMYFVYQDAGVDLEEALRLFNLAADQKYARAQATLGAMYHHGWGVKKDRAEAYKWSRLAAEQGHDDAQAILGRIYSNGWGVARDFVEAVKWYRLAAEQGHAWAQNNLGMAYHNGRGVVQNDDAEAVKWFRRAADQGVSEAQYNLGVMYHNGWGVPQNYKEAYIWHSIAAANGHEQSEKYRDDDAKLLSASGLEEARDEATRRFEEIRAKQAESEA